MSSVHLTVTLERPTRAQSAPRVLPIVRVVSAVAVTAAAVAVGMVARTTVRRHVDGGPDTPVVAICPPPKKSLS